MGAEGWKQKIKQNKFEQVDLNAIQTPKWGLKQYG